MRHLSIDIETYSSVDLKKSGLHKYVRAPDFQILLLAYAWEDGSPHIIDLTTDQAQSSEMQMIIQALADPNVVKHAYNAAFEIACLNRFWPSPLEQWRCTMVHGLYCGYVAGLGAVGEALGLPQDRRKLAQGSTLIRTFCIPNKPSRANGFRERTLPHHEPEKWSLFKQYCAQDVVTEMEVERRLSAFPVPDAELQLWVLDQQINNHGVLIDLDFVEAALELDATISTKLKTEANEMGVANPKSVQQLIEWLQEETDEELDNLRKDTVTEMLKTTGSERAKRMLQIRQELSRASVRKYAAMKNVACADGRARGVSMFYGASRTGRWAGKLIQLQNLPRNYLETLDLARDITKDCKLELLRLIYGDVPDTLSQLVRTAFIAPEGKKLIIADFSAIEARVIAWLAKEGWRQEVFATHGKIYEASASAMFGVPIEKIVRGQPEYALRQKGKVAELALGYQGGVPAMIKMGALGMGLTEEELPDLVTRWRQANRHIVGFWHALENAAVSAVRTGRQEGVRNLLFAREMDIASGQDFLTIRLPSGRQLFYARPFLATDKFEKDAVHYQGVAKDSGKWGVISAYGGKFAENVTQAIARDCLALTMWRLANAGYQIVFHVHDEVVIEARQDQHLADVLEIMRAPIPWAPGLLLNADGFETQYYKKD